MIYTSKGITLDTDSGDITYRNKRARLSPVQAEILVFFLREPGRVYSTSELAKYEAGNSDLILSNAVAVHIKNIRKKLGAGGMKLIETIRGKGYRFNG
jgi:DNA-binding response OmpR family regulator